MTARAAAVACLLTLRFREAVRQIKAWHRMCFEFVLPTLNLRLDYYSLLNLCRYYSLLNLYRYYYSYSTYLGITTLTQLMSVLLLVTTTSLPSMALEFLLPTLAEYPACDMNHEMVYDMVHDMVHGRIPAACDMVHLLRNP